MAGAGFTRRYTFNPGTTVITQIEGIVILDLPPPGQIQGVNSGVACLIAEFQDCTYAVAVDGNANVTTAPNPVQVFSGADLAAKAGGFDATIGDFGGSMGNGFVELRNKTFAQLIICPVNIASSRAVRQYRKLPWNTGPGNPQPVVPMAAVTVPAGTPFLFGTQQVNSAGPVAFTGLVPYLQGTDGGVIASTGQTEQFQSPSGLFGASGAGIVQVGDVIVLGGPISTASLASPTGGAFIGAADTQLFGSWTGYPASGLLLLPDTGEQIRYTGVTASGTGPSFVGITRGVNGTVGATHAAGTTIVGINNVDTYRVSAIQGATSLLLEQQTGANFSANNSFGASGVPWRLHHASDAESGVGIDANAAAYTVPARPLSAGVSAGQILAPQVPASAPSYNSWSPLSGLAMVTDPTVGLVYTPAIQAANPPASASFDALYSAALTAMLSQNLPEATVTLLWASRKSANIRAGLNSNVNSESGFGVGRVCVVAPDLQSVQGTSQAVASADPGVGANRSERVIYTWPPVQTFVPEAVNFSIKGSDGKFYTNGIIDMPADGWLISVLSGINPEWNPGQAGPPVPTILSPVAGLARNAPSNLGINDYIALKQAGICAIRIDRTVGPVFQSGVTTSLVSGQTAIQRRRFADYAEDSIADALAPLAKLPATLLWQDNVTTEIDDFLQELLSPNNPALQRINDYYIDDTSGNTQALNAQGIYVWIIGIQMTPTADFVVLQFNVGNGVVIPTQLAA